MWTRIEFYCQVGSRFRFVPRSVWIGSIQMQIHLVIHRFTNEPEDLNRNSFKYTLAPVPILGLIA